MKQTQANYEINSLKEEMIDLIVAILKETDNVEIKAGLEATIPWCQRCGIPLEVFLRSLACDFLGNAFQEDNIKIEESIPELLKQSKELMEATFETYEIEVRTKNTKGQKVYEVIEVPRKTPMNIFAYFLMASIDIPMGSSIQFFNENDDYVCHNDKDRTIDVDCLFNDLAEGGPLHADVIDSMGDDGLGQSPMFEPFTMTLSVKEVNKKEEQQPYGSAKILEYKGAPIWTEEGKLFSYPSKEELVKFFNENAAKMAVAYMVFEVNPEICAKMVSGEISMDDSVTKAEEQMELENELSDFNTTPKGMLN